MERSQVRAQASSTATLGALLAVAPEDADRAGRAMLALACGAVVDDGPLDLETVPYAFGSPATGGLHRLRGRGPAGPVSAFCKVLHHVRHWPGLAMMPRAVAQQFGAEFPWRSELDLWSPLVQRSLPDGLRSPRLLQLVDLGDDRVAVWQEDVEADSTPWQPQDFAAAAALLGRWNARCTGPELLGSVPYPPGFALRMYVERSVPVRGLAPLADDDLWSHPWLRGHADLRADLRALGAAIPAMLDRLDRLSQALPHGDASPQNLLRPLQGGDLVAIDLSFRSPHALGFDLGQLLVGLVHAGEMPASHLPEVASAVVPAYLEGVRAEGVDAPEDEIRDGFATSALLRSGFDGLRHDLLGSDEDSARTEVAERLALSRFLVDQHAVLGAR